MTNINEQIWEILDEYIEVAASVDIYEHAAIPKVEDFLTNQNIQWTSLTIDLGYDDCNITSFAWVDKDGTPNTEIICWV